MYRKKHSIFRAWNSLGFQASTGGSQNIFPWMMGAAVQQASGTVRLLVALPAHTPRHHTPFYVHTYLLQTPIKMRLITTHHSV